MGNAKYVEIPEKIAMKIRNRDFIDFIPFDRTFLLKLLMQVRK